MTADEDESIDVIRDCWDCGWQEERHVRVESIDTTAGDEVAVERAALVDEITVEAIRDRISNASKFQQWAFRTIQQYTDYKAEEHGILVETVAPAYTSQRCSHSTYRFTHADNRDSDELACLKCGTELHADYNAARNIVWRLLQDWRTSGA